ncbi:MAG: hypothetical protein IT385_04580 [Deltaproteobacteria bacterium]|nr:hypothetical protein [Deltaproteobacteria bacterium]
MRVTQQLLQNLVRQNTDRAARAAVEASRPIDEGVGISRASQDPIKATRLMGLRDIGQELDRFDRNRYLVKTDLGQAEEVLGSVHDLLVDAHDVALAMASDTVNAGDRDNAARQIRAMVTQALGLANRKDASGKHVFGGTAEDRAPYAADGAYQGNTSARMVEVGAGLRVEATIVGPDVFGPSGEALGAMIALATALEGNDLAGIQRATTDLAEARRYVADGRTEIGGRLATLADLDDLALSLRTHVEIERATIEGVDIAAVAPAMASAQSALEAVIASSKSLMQLVGRGFLGS